MQKTDITELRRLWEAANNRDVTSTTEYAYLSFRAFKTLPALLDELEAAREALSQIYWKSLELGEDRGDSTINHIAAAREREAGLLAMVERLREAIEVAKRYVPEEIWSLGPVDPRDGVPDSVLAPNPDHKVLIDAVDATASSALDDLRRRERSVGAEEKIRQIAEEECSTVFPDDLPHITQNQLLEMADAIAAERQEAEDGK